MNFRYTAILIGVVLVVGVVLLVVTLTSDEKKPETDRLTEELAEVKPEQIDTVEIEREGLGTLKIVRTDPNKKPPTWEIVEPYRATADSNAVEAVVGALMRAKPTIDPEPTSDRSQRDLDPAGLKVTLRQGTDKSSTVSLGRVTLGARAGIVYVTTSKRPNRPIAVPRNELDPLFKEQKPGKAADIAKWTADYRSRTIFPGDSRAMGMDVTSVNLQLPNKKKELALSQTGSGGWKFDAPAGWGDADAEGDPTGLPTTFTGVNPLLRTLTSLSASSAGDFIDSPKDLKEYGLNADNPDRVRVEMRTKDKSVVAYIGKSEGGPAVDPKSPLPPMGGKVYVMVEGQPGVIRANASPQLPGLVPVINDPSPLRDRNLITLDPRKFVDGIDIILAGQAPDKPTKLRRVGMEWKLYGGPNDPQSAHAATAEKLAEAVTARRAIKDFPAPNPANFAAISATLYVWVDGFNPPANPAAEPAKKAEPIKLEFGRKEADTVYVRRTLPTNPPLVSEFALPAMVKVGPGTETVDIAATVSKTRLDLLDRSLPSFSDTSRIAVSGAGNYTLAKDEKPDPTANEILWRFVAPDPRAGKIADSATIRNDIIYYLANASSQFGRFVDEAPTPEKLAEYGFTPAPRLKAAVDLPPDPTGAKQLVFEFGKDTSDPNFVYARIGGKAAVFTLGRTTLDRLTSPDLRDRVIFRDIPVAQVNDVELTGWGGIKLKFQKNKDGVWTASEPAGFMVDPAKVNTFLNLITKTRVNTFEKGTPEGKHGFGDPKQNLQVKLSWPGGAILLHIGASPDGGNTYYGWSAWLPQTDPVFTIDGLPFKPFKESSGGFAK